MVAMLALGLSGVTVSDRLIQVWDYLSPLTAQLPLLA